MDLSAIKGCLEQTQSEIHKANGHNDIPNANDDVINQQIIGSANDPMVDEFADDFMVPVNHQQVDELIDVHEDKTTVLQENVKDLSNKSQYVNVVKEDYKPCLGMVFANVKAKRKKCGIERNYVLRSVKERKKRLAMSLDSPFGQQATTTLASPKTISKSVNGDFIAPLEFLEDVSGEPKMRSINELMTLEVFVEQLLRPHNCIRDKVTLSDGFSDFIKMQDPPEYQFPYGYGDIVVDREFLIPLEVKLKNLPPHLEYAFLEDNNKMPVINAKDLRCR
ncbi:hypothetical protein Tco_0873059 [Tanacetum coccineum]